MTPEKEAVYQTEIVRLNKIITVLIEQNDLLKHIMSYPETRIGLTEICKPIPKTEVGQTEQLKSNTEIDIGQKEFWKPNVEIVVGQEELWKSILKTVVGQTELLKPTSETGVGQTEVLKPLPEILPTDSATIIRLSGKLHERGLKYMTSAARKNAAKLLIHFYNKSPSHYRDLMTLTGLSQGGLSKFMTSLRKRGLVAGTGWQKYAPTGNALAAIRDVVG